MSSTAIPTIHAVAPGIVPASPVVRSAAPPPAARNNAQPDTAAPVSSLEQAVERLNHYVTGSRTDLQFRVDREAGRLVVCIVDSDSGQVLRQMPSEDALRIARYLDSGGVGLLRQQA